ncbi:PREDICTED: trafficking protein particle complex subunit 5, partial [Leptosomus discolor]|uniref:trafficking protein particle complex subunit 5 n=1 Tax=Leptosomus discolor TaxID=188344 RepID=UPI000522A37D
MKLFEDSQPFKCDWVVSNLLDVNVVIPTVWKVTAAFFGPQVGLRVLDALVARERSGRRETKVLHALLFVKGPLWRALFGKEADKLEQANDDDRTFYVIEKEPLVNAFISVPRENSTLNCAAFTAGLVEAVLGASGFPAQGT